jgi:hypothetical protein
VGPGVRLATNLGERRWSVPLLPQQSRRSGADTIVDDSAFTTTKPSETESRTQLEMIKRIEALIAALTKE